MMRKKAAAVHIWEKQGDEWYAEFGTAEGEVSQNGRGDQEEFSGSREKFLPEPGVAFPVPDIWMQGITDEVRKQRIEDALHSVRERAAHKAMYMGYYRNLAADFDQLGFILSAYFNNYGDPWAPTPGPNTKDFEIGVVEWFASLWGIQSPEFWGCVTNSGTDGVLHGLYFAREALPEGILYSSTESHYCVGQNAALLRIPFEQVAAHENGEMDYKNLTEKLRANKGRPAIVNANIGTTMRGAVDDIDQIVDSLQAAGYGDGDFYIHCDAAYLGPVLPFTQYHALLSFKKPISSISASGHKFLGCKFPCGIFISRKSCMSSSIVQDIEYVKTTATPLNGARNGHGALCLWYALAQRGRAGLKEEVEGCLEKAKLLEEMLQDRGINCTRKKFSNVVVFDHPRDEVLISKWGISCEKNVAHVIVAQGHSVGNLEAFAADFEKSRTPSSKQELNQDSISQMH